MQCVTARLDDALSQRLPLAMTRYGQRWRAFRGAKCLEVEAPQWKKAIISLTAGGQLVWVSPRCPRMIEKDLVIVSYDAPSGVKGPKRQMVVFLFFFLASKSLWESHRPSTGCSSLIGGTDGKHFSGQNSSFIVEGSHFVWNCISSHTALQTSSSTAEAISPGLRSAPSPARQRWAERFSPDERSIFNSNLCVLRSINSIPFSSGGSAAQSWILLMGK